jgi:hypothetical protein
MRAQGVTNFVRKLRLTERALPDCVLMVVKGKQNLPDSLPVSYVEFSNCDYWGLKPHGIVAVYAVILMYPCAVCVSAARFLARVVMSYVDIGDLQLSFYH